MTSFPNLSLSAAALACLFATSAQAESVPVTAADFNASVVGHCIVYKGPSDGRQCYAADGTTNYDDVSYGQDTGEWKTEGDDICVSWSKDPEWSCEPWTRDANNVYSDGEYTWTIE